MPENGQQAKPSNGKSAVKNSCKKFKAVCDVPGEGGSMNGLPQNNKNQNTMKTLIKLALAAVILCSTFAAQAGWVSAIPAAMALMLRRITVPTPVRWRLFQFQPRLRLSQSVRRISVRACEWIHASRRHDGSALLPHVRQ